MFGNDEGGRKHDGKANIVLSMHSIVLKEVFYSSQLNFSKRVRMKDRDDEYPSKTSK